MNKQDNVKTSLKRLFLGTAAGLALLGAAGAPCGAIELQVVPAIAPPANLRLPAERDLAA
jgi:hypothetical protein